MLETGLKPKNSKPNPKAQKKKKKKKKKFRDVTFCLFPQTFSGLLFFPRNRYEHPGQKTVVFSFGIWRKLVNYFFSPGCKSFQNFQVYYGHITTVPQFYCMQMLAICEIFFLFAFGLLVITCNGNAAPLPATELRVGHLRGPVIVAPESKLHFEWTIGHTERDQSQVFVSFLYFIISFFPPISISF